MRWRKSSFVGILEDNSRITIGFPFWCVTLVFLLISRNRWRYHVNPWNQAHIGIFNWPKLYQIFRSCPTSRPPKAVINRICSEMQLLTSEAYEDLERRKRISKQKRNILPTIPENAVPMIRTFARAARRISTSLSNIFFPKKSSQKTLKNTESEL